MPPNHSTVCEKCGKEFPDIEQYKAHRPRCPGVMETDPVSGEPIVVVAPNPKPEEVVEIKTPTQPKPVPMWNQPKEPIKEPQKVKLTYKYTGDCPYCGRGDSLATIELDSVVDNDKNHVVVVAWCSRCNKKVQQTYVSKL